MRILRVRFKNLNSLAGEWSIDLTDKSYMSDGIFAITGPTGAGKSTILDAMCLALYGSTPRLGRISKIHNEIMTRHTQDCLAEAVIETAAGQYCFHWSQRRTREGSKNDFQDARHEVTDIIKNEILSSKKSEVSKLTEEITGMNFDQFTKSMLLAQGGFDAFLKASPENRGPILEQITDTHKYTQIARYVHIRTVDEENRLKELKKEAEGISALTPEEEKEKKEDLEKRRILEKSQEEEREKNSRAIMWLEGISRLTAELADICAEQEELNKEMTAFREDRKKLGRAEQAATIDSDYRHLQEQKKFCQDNELNLEELNRLLPALENKCTELAKTAESIKGEHETVKKAKADAQPLLQQIILLDQSITDKVKTLQEYEREYSKKEAEIRDRLSSFQKEAENLDKARSDADRVGAWLAKNAADEWLVQGLAGILEKFRSLNKEREDQARFIADQKKLEISIANAAKELDTCEEKLRNAKKRLEDMSEGLQKQKDNLQTLLNGKELNDYREKKEKLLLEKARFDRIASFEEERKKLVPNSPCPLCGAMHHPYADGNLPETDATEKDIRDLETLIKNAEKLEENMRMAEREENSMRLKLSQLEKDSFCAMNSRKLLETGMAEINEKKQNSSALIQILEKEALADLEPLGIMDLADLRKIFTELNTRKANWQKQSALKSDMENKVLNLGKDLEKARELIAMEKNNLLQQKNVLDSRYQELKSLRNERFNLYRDKDPLEEGRLLDKIADECERKVTEIQATLADANRKLAAETSRKDSLAAHLEQNRKLLNDISTTFSLDCVMRGFQDEADFLAARLEREDIEKLREKSDSLEKRHTKLDSLRKDCEAKLAAEKEKKVCDEPLEKLTEKKAHLEEALKENRSYITLLGHLLEENEKARRELKEKQEAIAAQERETARWRDLHDLTGTKDGKKFSGFVQGLTFEILVRHANIQLGKMTDRYLLKREDKAKDSLVLKIIDSYQGGVVRGTESLSGGESFLVSLALALGLSHIASEKVRVDSLFLDEGFGTLDEESLDLALETLASLNQEGKMIGIISHVPALKERIATQISVNPVTGGRSIISGPGCKRL